MEIKYLDYNGLKEIFRIVSAQNKSLENDMTSILNGMALELNNKLDSMECEPLSDEEIEEAANSEKVQPEPEPEPNPNPDEPNGEVIFNRTFQNYDYDLNNGWQQMELSDHSLCNLSLQEGEKYRVTINGRSFDTTCIRQKDSPVNHLCLYEAGLDKFNSGDWYIMAEEFAFEWDEIAIRQNSELDNLPLTVTIEKL